TSPGGRSGQPPSLTTGGTGGGFGGSGSGGGPGLGGVGLGRDGLSGIGAPITKSFLLQPLAVNLVNAHEASDEIYIFLISKRARFPRPGKLTRRFRVIRIISGILLNSGIWGERLSFIDQNRVIDRDSRKGAEISNEYLPARQGFIELCVHLLLVSGVVLVNNPAVAWP